MKNLSSDNSLIKDIIQKITFYLNKTFYSAFFPICLFLIFAFIFLYIKSYLIILIIGLVLILILWLIKLCYIPKNKSGKIGIIFILNNSYGYNESINLLFQKIRFHLNDDFYIAVFNNNFLRKINFNNDKITKKFLKKNYNMIINSFVLTGKDNSDNICSLTNENMLVRLPYKDEKLRDELCKEFSYAFKRIIKLSYNNSYNDINDCGNIMVLSIKYFTSILFIIFGFLPKAEKLLKSMNFSDILKTDEEVKYLKNSSKKRLIEIYLVRSFKIIEEQKYLYNQKELKKLRDEQEKLESVVNKARNVENEIMDNLYIKAKILFSEGLYRDSLKCIASLKKKDPKEIGYKLSYAFLELYLGNVKGFENYKKIHKQCKIKIEEIDECISFIDDAMKNSLHDMGMLELCKGVLTYHWKDNDDGRSLIKSAYEKIDNKNIKAYIEQKFN